MLAAMLRQRLRTVAGSSQMVIAPWVRWQHDQSQHGPAKAHGSVKKTYWPSKTIMDLGLAESLEQHSSSMSAEELLHLLANCNKGKKTSRCMRIIDRQIQQRMQKGDLSYPTGTSFHAHVLELLAGCYRPKEYRAILHILRHSALNFPRDSNPVELVKILVSWQRMSMAYFLPKYNVVEKLGTHLYFTAEMRAGNQDPNTHDTPEELQAMTPRSVVQLLWVLSKPPHMPVYLDAIGSVLQDQLGQLSCANLLMVLEAVSSFRRSPQGVSLTKVLVALEPHALAGDVSPIYIIRHASSMISLLRTTNGVEAIQPFVRRALEKADPLRAVSAIVRLHKPFWFLLSDKDNADKFLEAAQKVLPKLDDKSIVFLASFVSTCPNLLQRFDMKLLMQRLLKLASETQEAPYMRSVLLSMCRVLPHVARGPDFDFDNLCSTTWGMLSRYTAVLHVSEEKPYELLCKAQNILTPIVFGQVVPPDEAVIQLLEAVLPRANSGHRRIVWQLYGLAAKLCTAPPTELTARVLNALLEGEEMRRHKLYGNSTAQAAQQDLVDNSSDHEEGLADADDALEPTSQEGEGSPPERDVPVTHESLRLHQLLNLMVAVVATYAHDVEALATLLPLLHKYSEGQVTRHVVTTRLRNELRCAHAIVLARTGTPLLNDEVLQMLEEFQSSDGSPEDAYKHIFCSNLDQEGQLAEAAGALFSESAVKREVGEGLMPIDALVTLPDGRQVALLYMTSEYEAINVPGKLMRAPAIACKLLDALGIPVVVVRADEWNPLDAQGRQEWLRTALEAV